MTTAGAGRTSPGTAGITIAAFDFDGTLTRYDSLLPFLASVRGAAVTARAVIAESPRFVLVLLGRSSRDAAKEALLTRLLRGVDAEHVRTSGQTYAERLVAHRLRPGMRRRLDWHRRTGHQVVIVSASPTLYLEPAAKRLGAHAVLATELEVGPDGKMTGRLSGRNCRGEEKARRLRSWLEGLGGDGSPDRQAPQLWVYGDSSGDVHMLALADVPAWVGWRGRLTRLRAR